MLAIIKDYLLTVLIRIIIGYILLVFFAVVAFVIYTVAYGWSEAVAEVTKITVNDFARIIMWLPFALAWFSDKRKGAMPTDKMSFAEKELLGFYK
ncbi:MAG: hypothetical protein PHE19_07715 [Candidatus Cloacimonetes bacterium]|nr:hypothetical protein [Candidatus Cloacimonadota bacterium]